MRPVNLLNKMSLSLATMTFSVLFLLTSLIQVSTCAGLIDCDKTHFNATWTDVPPYTYRGADHKIKGSIYTVAKNIVRTCCGDDVMLNLVTRQLSQRALEEEMGDVDMAFPVVKTTLTLNHGTIDGYVFLPLMETTGELFYISSGAIQLQISKFEICYLEFQIHIQNSK